MKIKTRLLFLILMPIVLLTSFQSTIILNSATRTLDQSTLMNGNDYNTELSPFNMIYSHTIDHVFSDESNYSDSSVTTILDEISTFIPENTARFSSVIIDEYFLEVAILNITVYNDHDGIGLGPGEIFLEVWANNLYTMLDNDSHYYVLKDDESAVINTLVFSGWTNKTVIEVDVKESDWDFDEDLGNILIDGVFDYNWTQIYTTSIGEADVAINATITGHRSINLDEDDVAGLYQPYVYLDKDDAADTPTALYYRVLEGFDTNTSMDALCIQYLYYWPEERDDFGNLLGHYYDFSPLYLYIYGVGLAPYKIVFQANNPGLTALPAQLEVYDTAITTSESYIVEAQVSEELRSLLGKNAKFDCDLYPITDFYNDQDNYLLPQTELPDVVTPIIMVTDSYHNLEFGERAISTTDLGYYPSLTELNDSLIDFFYELLEESFDAPLHDYAWNNYEVPENLSLTLDMKHDPFVFPYQIDCFENVTHQNRYARQQESADLDGFIEINTTLILPGILNITYPTTAEPGDDVEILISVDMLGDEVQLLVDYVFDLNATMGVWFIDTNSSIDLSGQIDVKIPLDTVSTWQRKTGFNEWENLVSFYDYLSLDYLFVDATLLGTIANASISIHLLSILEDVMAFYYPPSTPFFETLSWFIEGIDLVLEPELTGIIVGDLTATAPSVVTLSDNTIRFDEDGTVQSVILSIASSATPTDDFSLLVSNLQYGLNFTNVWSFVVDFSTLMNLFVDDWTYEIGTYPNLEWTATTKTGEVPSNVTSFQSGVIDINTADTTSETLTTDSKTSDTAPGFTLTVLLISGMIILVTHTVSRKSKK